MSTQSSQFETDFLKGQLAAHGLHLRGGFYFSQSEELNPPEQFPHARSCLLIGNIGGSIWRAFAKWMSTLSSIPADPLDRWTIEVISPLAERFGANAAFPFQKPYLPFQQWAKAAEGLEASPLGMLIHHEYGLWHAYRAALLFDQKIELPELHKVIHPCSLCVGKPCMNSCPVNAVSSDGFRVAACRDHLDGLPIQADPQQSNCMMTGCFARDACPVGAEYRYPPDQIRFHMGAFRGR